MDVKPLPPPPRAEEARKVLPELLRVIDTDLVKSLHYLRQSVAVAIVAQEDIKAKNLGKLFQELNEFVSKYQSVIKY